MARKKLGLAFVLFFINAYIQASTSQCNDDVEAAEITQDDRDEYSDMLAAVGNVTRPCYAHAMNTCTTLGD